MWRDNRDLRLERLLSNGGGAGVPGQGVPMITHPTTGQPLGVPAVIMAVSSDIMNALGSMVAQITEQVVRNELLLMFKPEMLLQHHDPWQQAYEEITED